MESLSEASFRSKNASFHIRRTKSWLMGYASVTRRVRSFTDQIPFMSVTLVRMV